MIKNTADSDDVESFTKKSKKSTKLQNKEIQEIHKDINTTGLDEENDTFDHDENIEDLKSVILNANANEEI